MSGDLSSFGSSLDDMFRRLGLPDPAVMSRLTDEWDAIAGAPWTGRSRPVLIQDRTLIVEAASPSMVAYLRYASADLIKAVGAHLGEGLIDQIEVRPPSPR
ncbi:MAG TPA: DUF721 domain-containing protein [Acidimicrobiia bacterium]|jgi:predicted nucleic acid-binding Zn ribbon protein